MNKARQNREVPQGKSPGYSTLLIILFGYRFTYISESEKDRVNRAVLTDCTRAHGPSWISEILFGTFFVQTIFFPPPVFTFMLLPTGGGCPLRRRPPADSQGGGIIHSLKRLYMMHGLFLFVEPTGGPHAVLAGDVGQICYLAGC